MKRWARYIGAIAWVAGGACVAFASSSVPEWQTYGLLAFPLAVLGAAWNGGLGPGLAATVLSALLIGYGIAKPIGSFVVEAPRDRLGLSLFVMISALQSTVLGSGRWTRRALADVNDTLRTSADKYRILFEHNPVPMVLVEVATRRILAANDATAATYGYTRDELVGTLVDILFASGAEAAVASTTAAPRRETACERWKHVTRTGAKLDVDGYAVAVPWPDSGAVLLAAHDVTARMSAEEALRRTAEALRRAKGVADDANQAKDRLIQAISHELRTPLTPVLLAVSALERNGGLSESFRATMNMIRRKVELEVALIDELLDASGIARGELPVNIAPVNARQSVERAVDACQRLATERDVTIAAAFAETRRIVLADTKRLDQVLRALIARAVECSPPRGHARVWTRDSGEGRVSVGVTDEGDGMTPEEIASVFEPFDHFEGTSSRRTGRLGLALSIGKHAIEACGGSLTAASAGRGRGSLFVIDLPAASRVADAHGPETPAPARSS